MQGTGMALLTILISVILFIFSLEKETLFEWDKIVILDKVIEAKKSFFIVALIFLTSFFWIYDSFLIKLFLFLLFVSSVIFLIKILHNSYRWIKAVEIKESYDPVNFRDFLRNKYLDEIKNLPEKEKVWLLTWRRDISNIVYERNLFKKFTSNIDELIETKNYELLQKYLQNFLTFVGKRALYDSVIYEDFFRKLLEWYFLICAKGEKNNKPYFEIESILSQLIKKFVLAALQEGASNLLFQALKEEIRNQDKKYIEKLFNGSLCEVFFDNITASQDQGDVWKHYFPKEWKITKKTIEDEENFISKIWCNRFFDWAQFRISDSRNRFDEGLNEVSCNLFPSVDPALWARILTMLMSPWLNNNRMESVVKQSEVFGFTSRLASEFLGSEERSLERYRKAIEIQESLTLELALILFKEEFTKERLTEHIKSLKELRYKKDSKEGIRQKSFIGYFEKMLPILAKREKVKKN